MTTIDEEKVCISWPLDGVDKRDISGTKQVSERRINDDSVLSDVDPGRMKDGTMTTEETEQTAIVKDDNGTKEEENVEEDEVLEDPYDMIIEILTEITTERKRMMEEMMDMEERVIKYRKQQEEVLHQQEQREDISLMTKDETEDDSVDNNNRSSIQFKRTGSDDVFDMESIYDVQVNHNDDTESIGANSILSDDWSAWSDWMSETESISAKSDLSDWSDWSCETESTDRTWKERIKTYCAQERQKQRTKIVKQRTTIKRVKDNSDANGSSYVWKGEIIKSNSENSLDNTTDTYSTDTTRDSCRSDVEQDTQDQRKVTMHANKERYVLSKIIGETAIEK